MPYADHASAASQSWAHAQPTDVAGAMRDIYWWMTAGLAITGGVALATASSETLTQLIFGNRIVLIGLIVAELALVIALGFLINRISPALAATMFVGYAALNGLTLSVIFLVYTGGSIATTFFVTAGTFGAMAVYGTVTKRDLTGAGQFAIMGLFGVIIGSVVNFFVHSEMLYWGITYAAILVFVILTAYDVQRFRRMAAEGRLPRKRLAIFGALHLYLDFINLFLYLLRLLGRRN